MPGKQVKDWPAYHRYKNRGYSKRQAAIKANAGAKARRNNRRRKRNRKRRK